ncbi:PilN domain-containing protein, partial [Moraxella caviae]
MIPKINLLPWRQTLKMRNHTRFWRCFALVFVASVLLAAAGFWHAWQAKIYQTHINDTINARTQSLQSELIELAHIEKQRSELMEKVQTINELQGGRVQMGRILAHINQALPNGVFIRSVERTGERLVLTGFARSSDGVSQFAKQLDAQAVRDVMVVALTDASD